MPQDLETARGIATAVRTGAARAIDVIDERLARIEIANPRLNVFTHVAADRARNRAAEIDAALARGDDPGPLAGVPFAVKNLFDVTGLPTLAGSKINASRNPALRDAVLIERLEAAGAVLVGALNMGEYAYDFTGENIHYGPSRNPLDTERMTGGSSGGSAGAVAGRLVPLSLGSDTNGSIRIPSSLCGLFGLKPTYGRLPRTGTFPFVESLDHLGPFARTATDLALAYDAMQGHDAGDAGCRARAVEPVAHTIDGKRRPWRVAVAHGYFTDGASREALDALGRIARALEARPIEIEDAATARAAAYLITTTEGAALHLDRVRTRAADLEPIVRDRLISGAMIPAHAIRRAHAFRAAFRDRVLRLFDEFDAIVALAAPCVAPLIGQQMLELGDRVLPLRANIGLYTQPISFVGLPVTAVPVTVPGMPIGVQIIAAPWREDVTLQIAAALEAEGYAGAKEMPVGA